MIQKVNSQKPSQIINIGCRESITKAEFALKFSKALNFNFENYKLISSDKIKRAAKRPKAQRRTGCCFTPRSQSHQESRPRAGSGRQGIDI